jgi:uncharacterized protein YhbP (UPF0306 family)
VEEDGNRPPQVAVVLPQDEKTVPRIKHVQPEAEANEAQIENNQADEEVEFLLDCYPPKIIKKPAVIRKSISASSRMFEDDLPMFEKVRFFKENDETTFNE